VAGRDDGLVVRELALDQPADEINALDVEEHLALVRGHRDLDRRLGIRQDAHQLGVRTPGHDDHDLRVDRPVQRQVADCDPVVVGRGERHPVTGEPGQHAGQDRPALVAGGGEDHLAERLAQDAGIHAGDRGVADGCHHRELIGLDALDAGPVVRAGELERAVFR
jgi:hypothetical protein